MPSKKSGEIVKQSDVHPAKKSGEIVKQSGVLPVYQGNVVLVTSRRKGRWTIPKGFIEIGMTPHESAALEALEEAGIEGKVHDSEIGAYEYSKWGRVCRVGVYEMQVSESHDQWLESDQRQRIVVPPLEAAELVWHPDLKEIVKEFLCT